MGQFDETTGSGGTNTFVRSGKLRVHKKKCSRKQKMFESFESLISASTIEQLLGWERSHADITAWCEETRGTVLRIGEQENRAVIYKVSTPCLDNQLKKERFTDCVRIIKKLIANRPEMLVLSSHRQAWHFMVCESRSKSCNQMEQSL